MIYGMMKDKIHEWEANARAEAIKNRENGKPEDIAWMEMKADFNEVEDDIERMHEAGLILEVEKECLERIAWRTFDKVEEFLYDKVYA